MSVPSIYLVGGRIALSGGGIFAMPNLSGAPLILMTDIVSGPMGGGSTTGDENGKGCYLSIYGINFGLQAGMGTTTTVSIGGQEIVARGGNYRCLIPAKVTSAGAPFSPSLQHIIVQVGPLGTLSNGTNYPVVVNVGGISSNSNFNFMPNPGKIHWIDAVNGLDTGSHTDITNPWKTPQTVDGGGNINGGLVTSTNMNPGDHIIFRAGTYNTTGKDSMCFRYFRITGLAPTGALTTGYIHHTPYPGPINGNAMESVTIFRPSGAASCIGGNDSARGDETTPFGTTGYAWGITISNFIMNEDPGAVDGPINNGSNSNYWRICNNELGPWLANVNGKAAGVAGDGSNVTVFANYIHDIQSPTTENHGIYMDGSNTGAGGSIGWAAHFWDISFNYIKNMNGGSGIQTYGVAANGNDVISNISVHQNVIDTTAKYGLNAADVTQSVNWFNNLVMNTGSYSMRTNQQGGGTPAIYFYNNTCINWMTASSGGGNACYCNESNLTVAGSIVELSNNLMIDGPTRTNTTATYYSNGAVDSVGAIRLKGNWYYDPEGHQTSVPGIDTLGHYGDPKITTNWTDFRPGALSPLINAATATATNIPTNDINNNPRPKPGNANVTIGCYEAT